MTASFNRQCFPVLPTYLYVLLISYLILIGSTSASKRRSKNKQVDSCLEEEASNVILSTPEECARECREGEAPKICYQHFHLEMYMVLGGACDVCTPNNTNPFKNDCQCVTADGVEKAILTANRQLPGPSIQVCRGDKIVIDIENNMEAMETSIHWHGVFQNGYQYYDGVPFITQCPIPQRNTFRYQFIAQNEGTHFWHSHHGLHKMDGIYGNLIIREPRSTDPNGDQYDYDETNHVILVSDWMHELASERFPGRRFVDPGQDPDSVLINGKGRYRNPDTGNVTNTPLEVFTITSGKRYRFRMVNAFCTVCPAEMKIQNHSMTVIATDGVPCRPRTVDTIRFLPGERYDVVIKANKPIGAYWIQLRALGACEARQIHQLAILRYSGGPYEPRTPEPTYTEGIPPGVVLSSLFGNCSNPNNQALCVSHLEEAHKDNKNIIEKHPHTIYIPFYFRIYNNPAFFRPNIYDPFLVPPIGTPALAFVKNMSFTLPSSPPLSQPDDNPPGTFCSEDEPPSDCGLACLCTNRIKIGLHKTVQLIVIDEMGFPGLVHPFHLHGYAFSVLGIGTLPDVEKINMTYIQKYDLNNTLPRNFNQPPVKDTIGIPSNGYAIIQFKADNPGYWLFHCHFVYHILAGMELVFQVGENSDLPPVPPGFPKCGNYKPPILPIKSKCTKKSKTSKNKKFSLKLPLL